jgi:hypothetical protein
MRCVRAIVFFGLLQKRRLAQRAAVEKLFEADVFRREAKFLRVHQFHFRRPACLNHPIGLRKVQTQRFLHNDVLARRRRIESDLAMNLIRCADHNHIHLRHCKELAVIGEVMRYAVLCGKAPRIARRRRCHREHFRRAALQRDRVDV